MGAPERAIEESRAATGLEQVYLLNRPALLRFLRARGADDEAEDLLQELWIKASAGASGPIREALPYLYRTANNLMLDRRRGQIRRTRRELDYAGEPEAAPSEEQAVIAREELRTAQEALSALGERTEVVFHRFRVEGASQKQIAEEQGISLSAVEKHLQRAYRCLIELRRRLDAG